MAAASPSGDTHVLEGNKEQEGKGTKGNWGRSGSKKAHKNKKHKQALDRKGEAKNVLKTTC